MFPALVDPEVRPETTTPAHGLRRPASERNDVGEEATTPVVQAVSFSKRASMNSQLSTLEMACT